MPINALIAEAVGVSWEDHKSCETLYLGRSASAERHDVEMVDADPVLKGTPDNFKRLLRKALTGAFENAYVIAHTTNLPPGLHFSDLKHWQCLPRPARDEWFVKADISPLEGEWFVRLPNSQIDTACEQHLFARMKTFAKVERIKKMLG